MIWLAVLCFLCAWLMFLVGPPWICGFFLCRRAACWSGEDRVKGYVVISSPRLARLLIPRYLGFHSRISTNIPALYNQYYVNEHPDRLSLLGLADYCVVTAISLWYGCGVTAYFFLGRFNNMMIQSGIVALMLHGFLFGILLHWNAGRQRDLPVITKKELRRRRQAEKDAKRNRQRPE